MAQFPPDSDIVDIVEAILRECPPAESKLKHAFAGGIYMRTMFVPAGSMLTSEIHLTEHFFTLISGEIVVRGVDGSHGRIVGPYCGITQPGERRVGLCLTDVIWSTYHATNETDPEEIERQIICQKERPKLCLTQQ